MKYRALAGWKGRTAAPMLPDNLNEDDVILPGLHFGEAGSGGVKLP